MSRHSFYSNTLCDWLTRNLSLQQQIVCQGSYGKDWRCQLSAARTQSSEAKQIPLILVTCMCRENLNGLLCESEPLSWWHWLLQSRETVHLGGGDRIWLIFSEKEKCDMIGRLFPQSGSDRQYNNCQTTVFELLVRSAFSSSWWIVWCAWSQDCIFILQKLGR